MVQFPERPGFSKAQEARAGLAATTLSVSVCSAKQNSSLPKSHIIPVPHIFQLLNWDCGLACVLMVLRAVNNFSHDLGSLHCLCPFESIWTVDLAHILRRCGLAVRFTTLTLGINPRFAGESFYGNMHMDEVRVARLFQAAVAAGIVTQQRTVPIHELQHLLLGGRHLVIALVDKESLQSGLALWSSPERSPTEEGYTGHYIVLCGYDSETDSFFMRDPDPKPAAMGLCSIKSYVFDHARRAFGTDEDLLFIRLPFFQGISRH